MRLQSGAPSLGAASARLHALGSNRYAGELRVANRGRAGAWLFLSVPGATAIVLREPESGRVLYRGGAADDLPVGRIAAGAVRTVEVELRPAGGRPLGFRWSAAAV